MELTYQQMASNLASNGFIKTESTPYAYDQFMKTPSSKQNSAYLNKIVIVRFSSLIGLYFLYRLKAKARERNTQIN